MKKNRKKTLISNVLVIKILNKDIQLCFVSICIFRLCDTCLTKKIPSTVYLKGGDNSLKFAINQSTFPSQPFKRKIELKFFA